jgi:hypothetical protein
MTEVIPITFDDPGQRTSILNLLGNVYADPRDALKEYVANSLDAEASNIVIDLTERKIGKVQVRDDGGGMDAAKLRSLPDRLAVSDKLLLGNLIGEKAIGILAFYSLAADTMLVWSSASHAPMDPHCLRFRKADLNPVFDPPDEERSHPWLKGMSGTVVELRGVPPDSARLLTLEKTKDHLARLYREILRLRPVRMVVVEGKKSEYVTAESFKGTAFWRRDVLTKHGRIDLQLYVMPSPSDRRIEVFCKGQRVCELSGLDDRFRASPWNTGQIHGVVSADFLRPTTGRSGFAANAALASVVDQLVALTSELQHAIDDEVETYRAEQDREMQRDLNNSFLKAILALKDHGWSGLETLVKSRVGDLTGSLLETGAGIKTTRRGRQGREGKIRRPLDHEGDEPATSGTGVNFEQRVFDKDEAHLRSKFDGKQALVVINMAHPDYREEYSERTRRFQYFHLLLAKELTLYNWAKEEAGALLEHLVELEITAKRYQGASQPR